MLSFKNLMFNLHYFAYNFVKLKLTIMLNLVTKKPKSMTSYHKAFNVNIFSYNNYLAQNLT